jgi:hypothetical protein
MEHLQQNALCKLQNLNFFSIDTLPIPIKDQRMSEINQIFSKHACQYCGSERKFVETLIDDEFF